MRFKFSSPLRLAVVFGCMIAAETAFAQQQYGTFAISQGSGTPMVGDVFEMSIHSRANSEPGAPAGTKYRMVKFSRGGKTYLVGQSQATKAQPAEWPSHKATISKVDSSLPIRAFDGINIADGPEGTHSIVLEVIQGSAKKNLGKMTIHIKE